MSPDWATAYARSHVLHGVPPREHVESLPDGDSETLPVGVAEQAEVDVTSCACGDRLPAAS